MANLNIFAHRMPGSMWLCIPASLLGTSIGPTFFRGLSDTQFTRAVNVLMIVSGLSYVV